MIGHQSQSLSQISNENWIASGVWPLMCVVSLTTLSMLTGHIRRSSISERIFWASRRGQSPEESTSEKESPRRAGILEIYISRIFSADWQQYWNGDLGSFLKEPSMTAIFFHYFVVHRGKTNTTRMYALNCMHPLVTIYRRPYRSNQS